MKKASIENMELGNLLFGHSRGQFAIDRETYQGPFLKFLDENGFDEYGYRRGSNEVSFENETFSMRPYDWGEDPDPAPNFSYKPENVEIRWYKYPLRDAYCSKDVSPEHFKEILAACAESLKEKGVRT